jgi:hypothetical protein
MAGWLSKLNPRKTNPYRIRNEDATQKSTNNGYQQICPFATAIFESKYVKVDNQSTGPNPKTSSN